MKLLVALLMITSFSAFAQDGSFETRIHSSLKISGKACDGNICPKGQWLITVDENLCSIAEEGFEICTEMAPTTFLAFLKTSKEVEVTIPEFEYKDIIPVLEVSFEMTDLISNYLVRFDLNGETRVFTKR
jgi:hypothetical protein